MSAMRRRMRPGLAVLLLAGLAGCGGEPQPAPVLPEGDPERGRVLLDSYGCTSCHVVPGIRGARGLAGPPLDGWAARDFVAGSLPNTPENLIVWIMDPDLVEPGTAMPDVGVDRGDALDIAAYLYTLP